jgi:two-component system, cell cycle response regulator
VLPGSDGYSVCRTIKRDPKTRLTPVVMLTSKSSPFDKIRGTLAGCDNYLTKPVTQDDFERTVKRYLQAPASVFQASELLRTA